MDPLDIILLVAAGLGGGFVAGLVGVGGGIVFAPVLFFFFQTINIPAHVIAPLTVGTSLLCTLTASSMSARQHHKQAAVDWGIALRVGSLSAFALYLIVLFVTTRAWYDRFVFQLVFGCLLLAVALTMWFRSSDETSVRANTRDASERASVVILASIGTAAGVIAGLAGVGGGIVMVPAYRQILGLSIRTSVGTSSGAIVVISGIGVIAYAVTGQLHEYGLPTLGFVDVAHGLLLAIPSLPGARAGAKAAHHVPNRFLQLIFATMAGIVACRMLLTAYSGL